MSIYLYQGKARSSYACTTCESISSFYMLGNEGHRSTPEYSTFACQNPSIGQDFVPFHLLFISRQINQSDQHNSLNAYCPQIRDTPF